MEIEEGEGLNRVNLCVPIWSACYSELSGNVERITTI